MKTIQTHKGPMLVVPKKPKLKFPEFENKYEYMNDIDFTMTDAQYKNLNQRIKDLNPDRNLNVTHWLRKPGVCVICWSCQHQNRSKSPFSSLIRFDCKQASSSLKTFLERSFIPGIGVNFLRERCGATGEQRTWQVPEHVTHYQYAEDWFITYMENKHSYDIVFLDMLSKSKISP